MIEMSKDMRVLKIDDIRSSSYPEEMDGLFKIFSNDIRISEIFTKSDSEIFDDFLSDRNAECNTEYSTVHFVCLALVSLLVVLVVVKNCFANKKCFSYNLDML